MTQEEKAKAYDEAIERAKNIYGASHHFTNFTIVPCVDWLKSLKDRITWKPSEEQMKALRIAAEVGTANDSWAMGILKGMYNELKSM